MRGPAAACDQCDHGAAQRLSPTDLGICLQGVEGLGDERNGRLAVNVPVGEGGPLIKLR